MTDYLGFRADLTDPKIAETYDDLSYWSSLFGQLLFRHLPISPGLTALDVGCGTGFPLLELADRLGPASSVHGIDSWPQAVERARKKARVRGNVNVQVAHGDAAELPYDDGRFHLVVSNLGVNNFDDPPAVLRECHRVLRPDGRLALTTNLVGHMREFYRTYEETLIATGHERLVDSLAKHVAHRGTPEGLENLLGSTGFDVLHCHLETFELRYADGSALLRAYLSRLGFLEGWRAVLRGSDQESVVFEELELRLNDLANASDQGLVLSIPAAYVEAARR